MLEVTSWCFVDRPPAEVFEVISDFEQNPSWQNGMVSCRFTTERPMRVGSQYEQQAKFLGRSIVSTFEVIELDPGRMVKATSIAGTFPITFTRIAEPHRDGTKVTAIVSGDSSGVFRLAAPLMKRMVKRSIDGDYRRLKSLLEK
ncbi:MAG: hypothetical protein HKN07_01330 [Acidimicrobiia bacterium]|nr:hypothetical protein [Acidimicrobiia bacterium]